MDFERIIAETAPATNKIVAVASAEDDLVLKSVVAAYKRGFITPILCGNRKKIVDVAQAENLDISHFEIIETASTKESAQVAVSLIREQKADILMKGLLQTAELLRAVLDKETGIRGKGTLSHVSIVQSPILHRTLIMTDAAMVVAPDLKVKVDLVKNAVLVAHGIGITNPKVAPLAAVEVVNPDMPATLDAAALTVMNRRGQITGCVVDGPFALDLAISEEAVRHKGVVSEVAGRADILLFHNIEAANSTLKGFIYGGNCLFGGVLVGATAPIVMTSRADSDFAKLYSIACAASIGVQK